MGFILYFLKKIKPCERDKKGIVLGDFMFFLVFNSKTFEFGFPAHPPSNTLSDVRCISITIQVTVHDGVFIIFPHIDLLKSDGDWDLLDLYECLG